MPYSDEWQPLDIMQLLVFGVSKIGKTRGACTFPRPVMFDFDGGAATSRNEEFMKSFGARHIFYETFKERDIVRGGIAKTHNAFDDACRMFDEWMKPSGSWKSPSDGKTYVTGRDKFDTFIIDSGTTLSELCMNKAIWVLGDTKPQLSHTHEQALKYGVLMPKMQDWGSERSLTEQFIDMVKDSGKHVVLLCHEKELSDDNGNTTAIVPMFTGQSTEKVPLKFDEVWNLRGKKKGLPDGTVTVERYLQTEADGLRKVGSRYGMQNNTAWNYDAVLTRLKAIKAAQAAQTLKQEPAK